MNSSVVLAELYFSTHRMCLQKQDVFVIVCELLGKVIHLVFMCKPQLLHTYIKNIYEKPKSVIFPDVITIASFSTYRPLNVKLRQLHVS